MSEPTENTEIPADIPEPVEAPAPEQPEPEPEKRGRGRPAGAKDRVKRTVKPKVRVEPIPAEPAAEPAAEAVGDQASGGVHGLGGAVECIDLHA